MTKYNVRISFKDIFGVYLLETLSFDGRFDMPIIGNYDDVTEIDYIALYSDVSEYNKTNNPVFRF